MNGDGYKRAEHSLEHDVASSTCRLEHGTQPKNQTDASHEALLTARVDGAFCFCSHFRDDVIINFHETDIW